MIDVQMRTKDDHRRLEGVLAWAESALREGRYEEVDAWLARGPEDEMVTAILAIATLTYHAPRERLPHRPAFMVRALRLLSARLGEARAQRLLFYRW